MALFVAEIVFCVGWIYMHETDRSMPLLEWLAFSSFAVDFVWIFSVAFATGLLWYLRTKRAELEYLLELRDGARF